MEKVRKKEKKQGTDGEEGKEQISFLVSRQLELFTGAFYFLLCFHS